VVARGVFWRAPISEKDGTREVCPWVGTNDRPVVLAPHMRRWFAPAPLMVSGTISLRVSAVQAAHAEYFAAANAWLRCAPAASRRSLVGRRFGFRCSLLTISTGAAVVP